MLGFWQKFITVPSNIFFACLILFILGIAVGNFFVFSAFIIFCLLAGLLTSLIFCWRNKQLRVIILLALFLILGFWRVQINAPDCSRNDLLCHYNNNQIKFSARIYDVSEETNRQKIQAVSRGIISGTKIYKTNGNVLIYQPLYPKYSYGDILIISCPLAQPQKFQDFDYAKYLAAKDIYSTCPYGDVRKISSGTGFWSKAIILKIKDGLSSGLKRSVSEPQSSILRAMIINETGGIPDKWNQVFSNLGLTHIIAISGSHITIIVTLIMFLAIAFGLSRPKAFWVAFIGIVIYIVMIGFPASAVRAAIMGILAIYAQKIGRASSMIGLIVLAAAVMLALNPLLLLYDVGFQLSFLAVIGLIYFSPVMERWLRRVPNFLQIREMLSATLAAQLMTMPLIVFQFGRFSPISILANILILPIIPFLTVFVLLNAIMGAIVPVIGGVMGWVSWLFTSYWLEVSILMEKINFFSFNFKITWWEIGICYIVIGIWIFKIKSKSKNVDL